MTDADAILSKLRRPNLLIKAARFGAKRYKRKKHLKSASPNGLRMDQSALLKDLMEKENDLEWNRRAGTSDYNLKRHVLVLSALLAEAKRARRNEQPILLDQANASGSDAFFCATKSVSASSTLGSILGL